MAVCSAVGIDHMDQCSFDVFMVTVSDVIRNGAQVDIQKSLTGFYNGCDKLYETVDLINPNIEQSGYRSMVTSSDKQGFALRSN